jgi:hypothetical protein
MAAAAEEDAYPVGVAEIPGGKTRGFANAAAAAGEEVATPPTAAEGAGGGSRAPS